MSSTEDPVTLTAHCLCNANIFTATIPKSKLPLPAYACHCDSCRHSTGALYSIDARWPAQRANVDVSKLKIFHFGPSVDILFCGTCSTPLFFADPQKLDVELGVFTGTLKNEAGNLVEIKDHIYVGDTIDGGATMWLRKPNANGSETRRFKERSTSEQYPFDWPPNTTLTGYEAKKEDSLPIRCKCRGVDLVLHRGNYEGTKKEDLPWFIDPNTYKPLAGSCVCNSCRLFGGVDVFNWTFAGLDNISFPEDKKGKPFPSLSTDLKALVDAKDPALGTLSYYVSSPGVQRYFCSECSACVFYAADDRPQMVDVAVGLLEASDGARAEGFLSWSFGPVGEHIADTEGGWRYGLTKSVEKESEEWRISRGYPKNWRRAAREDAGLSEKLD